MKQNLTRKPVIIRVFFDTGIIRACLSKIGITFLIFSVRKSFLRS